MHAILVFSSSLNEVSSSKQRRHRRRNLVPRELGLGLSQWTMRASTWSENKRLHMQQQMDGAFVEVT